MIYTGTIKDNVIIFEHRLPFADGLQVSVNIVAFSPPKGSPQAWLTLFAGTVSTEEADRILQGARECRTVDPVMWEPAES
jgi:hypothetical protein